MQRSTPIELQAEAGQLRQKSDQCLGLMNVYFLLKALFFWQGFIGFNAVENLALAALMLLPLQRLWLAKLRLLLAIVLAVALFYYDSWLPPISRLVAQADQLQGFTLIYLYELVQRFINVDLIAGSFAVFVAYVIVQQWLRVSFFIVLGLIAMLWYQPQQGLDILVEQAGDVEQGFVDRISETNSGDLSVDLADFFVQQQAKKVSFSADLNTAADFDILVLSICSLSWDDLAFTGQNNHPLLKKFDLLLTNFSSAASYSGPAAIRLLRASCGQSSHKGLYDPGAAECYLFDNLLKLGFEKQLLLNHNGEFDGYVDLLRNRERMVVPPMALQGLPIAQRSFDNTPIYADFATLGRWLDLRQGSAGGKAAAFYNSISLHDGNRLTGAMASLNSLENFHPRLVTLLDELERFFNVLAASGRPTVVIMVPEHGAAARGDKIQIAGLREIPTPAIANVPVGIKLFGAAFSNEQTLRIEQPTSYLAISYILQRLLSLDAYANEQVQLKDIVQDLPLTPFVAENEGTVVVRQQGRYFLQLDDSEWIEYPGM